MQNEYSNSIRQSSHAQFAAYGSQKSRRSHMYTAHHQCLHGGRNRLPRKPSPHHPVIAQDYTATLSPILAQRLGNELRMWIHGLSHPPRKRHSFAIRPPPGKLHMDSRGMWRPQQKTQVRGPYAYLPLPCPDMLYGNVKESDIHIIYQQ